MITFENGAVATLLASTAAFPENSTRIQVHGTRGSAYVQDGLLEYFHADDAHDGSPRGWGRAGNQAGREVGSADLPGGASLVPDLFEDHLRQYEDVIDAIRGGREPAGSIGDAVRALAVIIAVYVSSALGHPVGVDDVLDGALRTLRLPEPAGAPRAVRRLTQTDQDDAAPPRRYRRMTWHA